MYNSDDSASPEHVGKMLEELVSKQSAQRESPKQPLGLAAGSQAQSHIKAEQSGTQTQSQTATLGTDPQM